jgi:hypothetical protein
MVKTYWIWITLLGGIGVGLTLREVILPVIRELLR